MFYLVGLGLKPEHLTLESLQVLKKCKKVFAESYTSAYSEGSLKELEKSIGKKILLLGRSEVEEKAKEFLSEAKKNEIALCVFGNAFFATTHTELLLEAKKLKIQVRVLPGISLFDFVGATGLSAYKFGQTVSIVFFSPNFAPESFYDKIKKNNEMGLHTLCLLDLNMEEKEKKFMQAREAVKVLERIAEKRNEKWIKEKTFVALCGAGSKEQKIFSGTIEEMCSFSSALFPQSLIVCGELSEKEKEAMNELVGR